MYTKGGGGSVSERKNELVVAFCSRAGVPNVHKVENLQITVQNEECVRKMHSFGPSLALYT